MAWTKIGSVTVAPESDEVVVGPIDVPPQGGIELMVRQTSPEVGFRFAYGLVSFRSVLGRELGTVKVWARHEWSAFMLGEGLSSLYRSGALLFEPRSYNLKWIKAGYPWSLEFMADIGTKLPGDRIQAPGFVDPVVRSLQFVQVGQQGRIKF
jgi:hypothetical protein